MTSIDKYLIVDGRSGKKHKKQKKKKKNVVRYSSSDEDEAPAQLVVNRDIGEMPEGACISDEDEKDSRPLDDPHRALDIDLDA